MDDLDWKAAKMQRQADEAKRQVGALPPTSLPEARFGGTSTIAADPDVLSILGGQAGEALAPPDLTDSFSAAPPAKYGVQPGKFKSPKLQLDRSLEYLNAIPEIPVLGAIAEGAKEYAGGAFDVFDAVASPTLYAGRQVGKGISNLLGEKIPEQKISDWDLMLSDLGATKDKFAQRWSGDYTPHNWDRKGLSSQTVDEAIEGFKSGTARGALGGLGGIAQLILTGSVPTRVAGKPIAKAAQAAGLPTTTADDVLKKVVAVMKPRENQSGSVTLGINNIFGEGDFSRANAGEWIADAAKAAYSKVRKMVKTDNYGNLGDDLVEEIKSADEASIADVLADKSNNPALYKALKRRFKFKDADIKENLSEGEKVLDAAPDEAQEAIKAAEAGSEAGSSGSKPAVRLVDSGVPDVQQQQLSPDAKAVLTKEDKIAANKKRIMEELEKRKVKDVFYERMADDKLRKEFPEEYRDRAPSSPEELRMEEEFKALEADAAANKDQILEANKKKAELRTKRFKPSRTENMDDLLPKIEELRNKIRNGDESKETEQALRALTERAGELSTRAASKMKVANAETRLAKLQNYVDAHPDKKYLVGPDNPKKPGEALPAPASPKKLEDEAKWDLVVDQGLGHRSSRLAYDSMQLHDKAADARKILDDDLAALNKYKSDDIETAVIKRAQEQGMDPGKYLDPKTPIPEAPFKPPKKDVTLNVSEPKPSIKRPRIKKAEPVADKPVTPEVVRDAMQPHIRGDEEALAKALNKHGVSRKAWDEKIEQDIAREDEFVEGINTGKIKLSDDYDPEAEEYLIKFFSDTPAKKPHEMSLEEYEEAGNRLVPAFKMKDGSIVESPGIHSISPERIDDVAEEGFTLYGRFMSREDAGKFGRGTTSEQIYGPPEEPPSIRYSEEVSKAKEALGEPPPKAEAPEAPKPEVVQPKRFKKAEAAPKAEKPKSLTGEKPQPRTPQESKVEEWAERQLRLEKMEEELLKDNKTSYDWSLKDEEIKKLYDSSKDPIQGPPRDSRPIQGPQGDTRPFQGPKFMGPEQGPPRDNRPVQGPEYKGPVQGPSKRKRGEFAGYRAYGQFAQRRRFVNPLTTKNTRGLFRDFGGPANTNNIFEEFHGTISNMEGPAARELAAKFSDIPKRALDIASKYMPRLMKSVAALGRADRAAVRRPYVVPGHTSMEVSRAAIEMDEHTGKLMRGVKLDPLSRESAELFDASKEAMKINHEAAVDAGAAVIIPVWDPNKKKMLLKYDRLSRSGPDQTRFLRQPNRQFSEHIRKGNLIGEKFMEDVAAVPINKKAGVTPEIVEHVFAEAKAAYARGEAFEFRRFIPFIPDWWTYRSGGSSRRFQVNDMIDNFVPTKGASGKSIATVMSHQSKRASFVEGVGNIHVPPDVAGFKSIINDGSVANVRTEITGRSNIGPAAKKAERFESALEGLSAAVSGNRSMAGYSKSMDLIQPTAAGELWKAALNATKTLATSLVPLKSITQPFMLAAHMPGGLHKNAEELVRISLNMIETGVKEMFSTGSKKLGKRFTTSRDVVAKHGLAQDDIANQMMSVFSHKPGSQHTANKVADIAFGTPVHAFQAASDMVKRSWDAVAIISGERQARQYAKLASQGKLKASDYVDLTQRGASNDSIDMLVNYRNSPPTKEQMDSFIREIAVNEAQITQRNLGQAHQNTRFLNSDGAPRLWSFLGYPTTMMRETENIFKKAGTTAKMSLEDARTLGVANTPEELARIKLMIVPKMIKDAVKLYIPLGAGGMLLDSIIDSVMKREDTELEKRLGIIGQFAQGLVAVNAYGLMASMYDIIAAVGGFPRAYATRGGKEERHFMPVEPFVVDAIEKAIRIGAAGIAEPFTRSGLVDPKKGTKGFAGEVADLAAKSPIGRMIAGTPPKAGGKFDFSKYKKQNLTPNQNQLQPPREGRYNFKKYKREELQVPATGKFNFGKYKRS